MEHTQAWGRTEVAELLRALAAEVEAGVVDLSGRAVPVGSAVLAQLSAEPGPRRESRLVLRLTPRTGEGHGPTSLEREMARPGG